MSSILNPYLNFNGNAKEAMEFYHGVFGGDLHVSTFAEGGMPHAEDEGHKIMHAQIVAPNGITIMASDTPSSWPYNPGTNIHCSLSGSDENELTGYWNKLGSGAKILQPLEQAPWGDQFGMLVDKYGIQWLVNINTAQKA